MDEILGHKFRDKVTGFVGVAVGHVYYISGCTQTLLSPRVKDDGSAVESQWYDDQRLEVLLSEQIVLENGNSPGFEKAAPKI